MRYAYALGLLGLLAAPALAQTPTPPPPGQLVGPYRASATKVNDLVHTKLAVKFDYAKRYLYGQEWVTLRPHGYPTDSLRLDAQGMDIQVVALLEGTRQIPLQYTYTDQNNLYVSLGRSFKPGEAYTVYLDYVAKPDELKAKGSAAITDAKGLYFINPDSAVAGKPVQIWTQGETQSASAWFPTIDRPNQKSTEEIAMTVPSKYVTLSNGRLVSQVPAGPGLRTDTWQMDLPHAPYLFMMAVGDFKIYKDTWRGKEVTYYLESKYAPFAKQIFGNTPDMLEFFSNRLGVAFPWNKYAQIVVRDYVSGAMENTTATLHGEQVQLDARELLDREYPGESVIAHELFHQWFGDYVTAESWSNITVNESMADFSEGLYAEHKYGREAADYHTYANLRRYLANPTGAAKDLVRFHYATKEDVFDVVTYQKGGAVVDMLRTYLGDDVFFGGLQKYLKDNALGTGEAHQLRLAMEAASGQDLNWFFNQWYFGAGHPLVTIDYAWDAARRVQRVTLTQTQPGEPFRLPLAIDYYVNGKVQRQRVLLTQASQTFEMPLAAAPALVNVDAEKKLVWLKTDHKPFSAYAYQYAHAPLYVDRREALAAAQAAQAKDPAARALLLGALNDKFYDLRRAAAQSLDLKNNAVASAAAPTLRKRLATEQNPAVQTALLGALGQLKDKRDAGVFTRYLAGTRSYAVQGAALQALAEVAPPQALAKAQALEGDDHAALTQAVVATYAVAGGGAQWPYIREKFDAAPISAKVGLLPGLAAMLPRLSEPKLFAEDVARLQAIGIQYKSQGADHVIIGLLQNSLKENAHSADVPENRQTLARAIQQI
ncbi:peptidase M1 (plasmid) [Hymenobacter psoromatis]|nr:peptidase M1 [Hymenobacter psoromatis]